MHEQSQYADSFQAMEIDRTGDKSAVRDAILEPVDLEEQAIRKEIERVKSAARVQSAIMQLEVFFGYKEPQSERRHRENQDSDCQSVADGSGCIEPK